MNRTNVLAALSSAVPWLLGFPALALAQANAHAPSSGAPAPVAPPDAQGSTNWLWIIAALVVLALIWWAVQARGRAGARR